MNVIIDPLIFKHQVCPKCKRINKLVFLDQYKHRSNNPIYPATALLCEACNTEFPIYWKKVDDETIPYPGNKEKEKEVTNDIIEYALQKVRKLD